MDIVKRYLKPYYTLVLIAVLALFAQVFFNLRLPSYMAQIVNVGLQQRGVLDTLPEVISEQSLPLLTAGLSAEEAATLRGVYNPLPAADTASFAGRFAAAQQGAVLVAKPLDAAARKQAEQIYKIASARNASALEGAYPEIDTGHLALPKTDSLKATFALYRALGVNWQGVQRQYMLWVGGLMLLMTAASVVMSLIVNWLASVIGAGFSRDLRRGIFHKVETFSAKEFDTFSTASLITRTTNDVSQLQMLVMRGLRMMGMAPVMAIGATVMAWRQSPSMAWIIGLGGGVVMVLIGVLFKVATPKFQLVQKLVDKLNLVLRENLNGILVVRAFNNEGFEERRFDAANKELSDTNKFIGRVWGLMMPITGIVQNGIAVLILWLGADQIARSQLQVGDMMAFMQYATQVIMNFFMISMMMVMIPRAMVSAQRVREVLSTEPAVATPESPAALPLPKGLVRFDNVSFRYPGAERDALENISFTARPGTTTAIIGPTGSGKSTLSLLLSRLYDPREGKIYLDGVDISTLDLEKLREQISLVPQKNLLFTGTVTSNILYGRPEASTEEVQQAAEDAMAHRFVSEMTDGYAGEIAAGGTNVSGGQRARLAIARGILKKASVYLFDDSFSALDFATDVAVRRSLAKRLSDATVFIVAQRVSTIMHADQIIVLENGRVAGIGTHAELLRSAPVYKQIVDSQLGNVSAEEVASA